MALLALEAKQYDTAGEFFRLALAAKPKQADEVFMVWGVGLLTGDRPAEAVKVFQRGDRREGAAGRQPDLLLLSGRRAGDGRADRRGPGRRADGRREEEGFRPLPRPRRPGCCISPSATTRRARPTRDLIDDFDVDHASAETRDVLREARLCAVEPVASSRAICPRPRNGWNRCSTSSPTTPAP